MARKASSDKTTKIVKTIPSSENGSRTTCVTKSGQEYLITNDPVKERFTLWRVCEDGYEKINISDSPLDFNSIIYPENFGH